MREAARISGRTLSTLLDDTADPEFIFKLTHSPAFVHGREQGVVGKHGDSREVPVCL